MSRALKLFIVIVLSASLTTAQNSNQLPDGLTTDEQTRLEKEHGDKDRVELLLKIAMTRLGSARNNINNQQFEEASSEIKLFGSLVDYALAQIVASPKKEKDKRNIYRAFELNVRRDLNSLESMRFELPEKYVDQANEVYEKTKKARETALAEIFGKDFFPVKE